ncbi:endolytic transglycosylase MltG [Patescibacteria group bacterium]|nr:endolytic transglycosylase MltG [Patescibacteria group bacterium]
MKSTARLLATLITIGLLLLIWGVWQVYWSSPAKDAETIAVTIEEGSSLKLVSDDLKEQKIINSKTLFRAYAKWKDLDTEIRAGEFYLQPGMSVVDALETLTVLQAEPENTLTFLEGWSLRDYGYYLENQGLFQAEELHESVGFPVSAGQSETEFVSSLRDEYELLASKPTDVPLEGYLFPDTYRFFTDATLEDMVRKMLDNLELKLTDEMLAEIERQGRTVHEVLTLASIVEREARGNEDQAIVADIFWRRLEVGQALQACSTVNYVTGKSDPAVTYEDQAIDSPYNTYLYRGLPPGPIANPGLGAIEATIYPTANNYWYFLTDNDGNMHYSSTYDEHLSNKATYLR